MKKRIAFFIGLLMIVQQATAQTENVQFDHLSIEDGLSQSTVFCILQDSKGFLWFGTHDGLNRYDGYSFVIYKNRKDDSASIGGNIIHCLHESKKGEIWIGTYGGGISVYNPVENRFRKYNQDPASKFKLSDYKIRSIQEDNTSNIWVCMEDKGGVVVINPATGHFEHFGNSGADTLADRNITDMLMDKQGNYWFTSQKKGVSVYNASQKKFKYYQNDPQNPLSLADNNVPTIYQDKQGNIWLGTNQGLCLFDPSKETFRTFAHDNDNPFSLSNNTINRIFEDASGKLWVGTSDGLNILDRQSGIFRVFKHEPTDAKSLGNNNIASIYEDHANIVWIGAWERGLSKYDRNAKKFRVYKHLNNVPQTFPDRTVRSIYEDNDGTWWIGYVEGGVVKYNPKSNKFEQYQREIGNYNTLFDNTVSAILRDKRGDLWFGTWNGGLHKAIFTNDKITSFEHYTKETHGFGDNRMGKLFEDSKGRLWVGNEGGLDLFDRDKKTVTAVLRNMGSVQHAFAEDNEGNLWVGTWLGICKITTTANGIETKLFASAPTISLCIDKNGVMWTGTFGSGIIKAVKQGDTLAYTTYNEDNGLANNVIYALFADTAGNIWASSNKGISKFDTNKLKFTNYDESSGLQSNEFFWGAGFQSKSGQLFFGGIGGLNAFYPGEVKDNPYTPPVVLTDFKMFNASVSIGEDSPLHQSITVTSTIELSYKDKVISFEFSSLHFSVPQNNQYAYKLEGFNDRWIYTDADKRFATYTNLDPGKYVFRVKGSNSDGVWNEDGVAITVIVEPPFWETWWFRLLGVVLVVGGAFTLYRMRINQIQAQKNELERQVKERTLEVVQKNEVLEQQKSEIEKQAAKLENANRELETKNDEIEMQNEQIRGSIRYALKIQTAILPFKEIMDECFENFVIYRPKDIVSGDFYWFTREKPNTPDETIFIVVADCTGHGVPGAFMSMIGYSLLNEIVRVKDEHEPGRILDLLNDGVVNGLQQKKTDNNDGMDVVVCRIERKADKTIVTYSGAKNSLYCYHTKTKELKVIEANNRSVGGYHSRREPAPFAQTSIEMEKGDLLYLMSDGLIDQHDSQRKRFGSLRFKQLALEVVSKDINEQKALIENSLDVFQDKEKQRDDITLVGIKL